MKITDLKWPLAAAGFCLVIFVGMLILPAEPGVTRCNYSRVRIGMHKSEVESLFGAAANEPSTLPTKWLGLFLT